MRAVFTLVAMILCLTVAKAQHEADNWYFGQGAGLNFSGSSVAARTDGKLNSYEACASVSDANGNLLFYTEGVNVWDKYHTVMPNGSGMNGNTSTSQGVLIVRQPGSTSRYYLFNVDAIENLLVGGLNYTIIDMTQRAGLGSVLLPRNIAVPASGKVTEKLTATLHANGTDIWISVHGWENNNFYSYLLTSSGLTTTPVISQIGRVHIAGGGNYFNANAGGYMRTSPNGKLLAVGVRDTGVELFDFNNSTGQVSNQRILYSGSAYDKRYGVAFSPDNSKLYVSSLDTYTVEQYDLSKTVPTRQVIAYTNSNTGALQLGPDGRIYVSLYSSGYIGVINTPNLAGTACGYSASGVALTGGRTCQIGLPNFPNTFAPVAPVPTIGFTAPPICLGATTSFVGFVTDAPTGSSVSWNFGEPASGTANTAIGLTPSHIYASPGIYSVTMQLILASGQVGATLTQPVNVYALPTVTLGAGTQQLCAGETLILTPTSSTPIATLRWQDGTTSSTYIVSKAGTYWVEVASPQGCIGRSTVQVQLVPKPNVQLGADTSLCFDQPLVLKPNPQPVGTTYKWQDGSTTPTFIALSEGTYSLEVIYNGCASKDEIVIKSDCPMFIPNIITPDNDQFNQTFFLKGVNASAWNLKVFSKWGRLVFQKDNYDNSWNAENESSGMYYYILTNSVNKKQMRGWIQVVK